jgi:hypothetical protein
MVEARDIVHVTGTVEAPPVEYRRFRDYLLTDELRKHLESQGAVIAPADEHRGRVLLKPPIHLEDLYFNLAYGDVI